LLIALAKFVVLSSFLLQPVDNKTTAPQRAAVRNVERKRMFIEISCSSLRWDAGEIKEVFW
jgi:hypothetical protein